MSLSTIFAVVVALAVLYLIVQVRKSGPAQLSDSELSLARVVHRWTRDHPGDGWQGLGSRTSAEGLNLRFDADDDPEAEATLILPGAKGDSGMCNMTTVRLGADFETFHTHTAGHVFRIRMRGTGTVVGREVRLLMKVGAGGQPYGGRIENDDDIDAAVGGWIEVEWAEILRTRGR